MRLAILFCGLISGIGGLGFGWWNAGASLVDASSIGRPAFILLVIAIHLISLAAIGGGVAVLAFPRIGGLMILVNAIGWLLIVALLGHGIGLSVGALIAASAGGGLLAFLPSLNRPAVLISQAPGVGLLSARSSRPAFRPRSWENPTVPDIEDHSRPFVATAPELPTDERRAGVAYRFVRGNFTPLAYRQRRRSPAGRVRRIAGLFALVTVVIGVPTLLILDKHYSTSEPVSEVAARSVAPEPAPSSKPAASSKEPVAPAKSPQRLAPGADLTVLPYVPPAPETSAEPSVIAAEPAVASGAAPVAAPAMYATPFDYCGVVTDADEPLMSAIGSGLPAELLAGVRKVTGIPDAEVLWRCMSNEVWICAQPPGGAACGKVPTPAQRQAFCAAQPGSEVADSPGGAWRCSGSTPVADASVDAASDPRGFNRQAWLALTKAAAAGN